jgi:hypothetical protein
MKPDNDDLDDDIVSKVYKARKQAQTHLGEWREKAERWYAMRDGNQWTDEERADFEAAQRMPVEFNRIAAVINAVSGSEVSNRQEAKYIPRKMGNVQADDIMNAAAAWVRDLCDAEDEDSDAFRDMLTCGYGWTETQMDYDEDPEGRCVVSRRDPLIMLYDPSAKKRNLADKKWVQTEDWYTPEEIEARWPDAEEIDTPNLQAPAGNAEAHDATNAWKYEKNQTGYDQSCGKHRVIHHVWIETEVVYRVVSPDSGQIVELPQERWEAVSQYFAGVPAMRARKRVYKQAFVCGKIKLEEGNAPSQKGFPYQCMTGYRDHLKGYFFGLVTAMEDPQKFANAFLSHIQHIFKTNAKGGLLAEENAIANPRKFENSWAKADSISYVAEGALSQGKVIPKPPPAYPAIADKMMEFCIGSIRDVSGVNVELLGMADREQAGVLEAQRTKSALVILATLFDSLRQYRKRHGRVLADFIINYLSDGRLIRITGNMGDQQYIPLIRQPGFMEYDVVVDEATTARDVKERTWVVLTQLLPILKEMGIQPPPSMLDYSPLPSSLANDFKQTIQQAKTAPPPPNPIQIKAQADAQLEQARGQVELQKIEAKTRADMALAAFTTEQDKELERFKATAAAWLQSETARIAADGANQVALTKEQGAILRQLLDQLHEQNMQASQPANHTETGSFPPAIAPEGAQLPE